MAVCFKVFARRRNYEWVHFCFTHWVGVLGIQRQDDGRLAIYAARVSSDSADTSDEDGGAQWHVVSGAASSTPRGGDGTVGELARTIGQPEGEKNGFPVVSIDTEGIPPRPPNVSEGIPGDGEVAEVPRARQLLSYESIEEMTGFKEENDSNGSFSDGSFSETDDGVEWEVVHR
jgi:hypothetical protein